MNHKITHGQMTSFGVVMGINFPLFGYLTLAPSSMMLRLIATSLCLLLALSRWWPERVQWILPAYWFCTVLFTLPFFFTYLSLVNGGQTLWLLNWMSALFFLYLVMDAGIALLMLVVGVILAGSLYHWQQAPFVYHAGVVDFSGLLLTVASAVIIGTVFSGHRQRLTHQKLLAMRLIAGSIAHELRTPLASIQGAMQGWLNHLPLLLDIYQRFHTQNSTIKKSIRGGRITNLEQSPQRVMKEIAHANFIVDTFLTRVNIERVDPQHFQEFSVNAVVKEVLARYPYNSTAEATLIDYHCTQDFTINGVPELFVHVFFNLLKNAFYFIAAERRGEIAIRVEVVDHQPTITFTDTARGIEQRALRQVFKRFYSERQNGTGIGLAFCQLVVSSFGGTLRCESELGQYTRFVMHF